MTLRRIFVDPPQPTWPAEIRYGLLALICGLLAWGIYVFATRSPSYHGDPYGNMILAVTLLLNHIAFQFHLPPRITVATRILAIGWLAFTLVYVTLVYVSYLSRIHFPLR